jgi:hypothetical protein
MTYQIYQSLLHQNVLLINLNIKSSHSICAQLNLPSSQSCVSQLGFKTENTINQYINTYKNIKNMKNIYYKIGPHQIDIIFEYQNVIYYFESKNNMKLDTEKSIKSKDKLIFIEKYLKQKYKSKIIICKFLNMWISNSDTMNYIKKPIIKSNIYGYSDFFSIFNINVSQKEYNKLILNIKKILNPIPIILHDTNYINKYKYLSLKRKYSLLSNTTI